MCIRDSGGAGHRKGVLSVLTLGGAHLVAVLVGDGQALKDIALVRRDGHGHGVALLGILGADGHAAVVGSAHGHGILGHDRAAATAGGSAAAAVSPVPLGGQSDISTCLLYTSRCV